MKKIVTLFSAIAIGTLGFSQVVFQSDLSTWTGGAPPAGVPTGWMGSKTTVPANQVVQQTVSVTYGTSMASLINTTASHQRFTTIDLAVVAGGTYEIEMWVGAQSGQLRTGFYDVANNQPYYQPFFDMAVESGGTLTLLTQQVTVPAGCTSGQFVLSLHSTSALTAGAPFYVGILVDSVAITQIPTPPTTLVDIYDIQYTVDVSGDSPELNNTVTTRGVVTGVIGFGADADRFFIQDGSGPWRGIYVYENGTAVTLGDSVEVTGTVSEYFGLTELTSVSAITIVSSGNPQPIATAITTAAAAAEENESVLVKVSDAICNNPSAGFGTYIVNDGSGNRTIDDQIYTYVPVMGNAYDITGVTFLSFSEVKIYPRIAADITTVGYAGVEENNAFSMYPNPASSNIKLNVQADATVNIYAITGELIYQGIGNGLIDVTNFSKGLYQVVVTQNEITSTQKLIVQ